MPQATALDERQRLQHQPSDVPSELWDSEAITAYGLLREAAAEIENLMRMTSQLGPDRDTVLSRIRHARDHARHAAGRRQRSDDRPDTR